MKRTILLLLCLLFCFGLADPSFAMVRKIEEAPGHFVLQSRHQLKDKDRSVWQVVLFARPKELQLRLVGFPDRYHFRHPDPLILETISGAKLLAQDDFPKSKEVPNVGQYNLLPLMSNLPTNQRLILTLPLQETDLQLIIPSAVMVEWRSVIEQQGKL
jgi:hypothetical protein